MKASPENLTFRPAGIHAGCVALAALLALVQPTLAQGAPLAGLPGANPAAAQADPLQINPDESNASRFVTTDELTDYITTASQKLSILDRESDPFGQVQDPAAKPTVIKPKVRNRPTTVRRTSFDDIIGRIKINAIMPAENRFLIGTRSFKLGDKFPINMGGRKTMVEVVAVKSNRIDFKNTTSGEVSSAKVSLMPAGMKSGGDGFNAPGMVPDKPDAPLQLDPASPGF